jgi:uncharacterized protein YprB with RNaseH-like and TPR domain
MLRNTFIHLPGIGPRRERWLWERGCLDWERFLAVVDSGQLPGHVLALLKPLVQQSVASLVGGDAAFFGARLPSRETWRLYPDFAEQALFLDIETTGLSAVGDEVTVIGAFAEGRPALFIQGINLHEFPAYVARFPVLITFNGSQFDLPFLRAHFPQARLDQAHIDLRFVFGSLGYRGGLKAIERNLGVARPSTVRDVDGFEAVRLWHRYRRGDRRALEQLLLYNLADTVNMVRLVEIAVAQKAEQLAFPGSPLIAGRRLTLADDDENLGRWVAACLEQHGA